MDPNIRLLVEELVKQVQEKVREEIRGGFTMHESTVNNRFSEFALMDQQREVRVVALESAVAEFDKSFIAWKPEVDSSLTSVKLELSKMNSFFDSDAKATSTPQVWSPSDWVNYHALIYRSSRRRPVWAPC
jgi:hypothetical protein